MRANSVASVLLAILSFMIGSYLILSGMILWGGSVGIFVPYAPLGAVLVFMALPTAMFGFKGLPRWAIYGRDSSDESDEQNENDSLIFSNKRIVGLSLLMTGTVWLLLSLIALFMFTPFIMCTVNYCPTPFDLLFSLGELILIGIGLLILVAGVLLILTSRSKSPKARQSSVGASLARPVR